VVRMKITVQEVSLNTQDLSSLGLPAQCLMYSQRSFRRNMSFGDAGLLLPCSVRWSRLFISYRAYKSIGEAQ
jgi:hypothetical protein